MKLNSSSTLFQIVLSGTLLLGLAQPVQAGAVKYIMDDFTSPVTTPALTPLLVGAGLTAALFITKSETSHPVQESITRRRPLDKYAKLGDWGGKVGPNLIYTGGALLSALLGSERGLTRAEEMVMATAYSGIVSSVMKVTFREARPNSSPTAIDRKSFPSGHATTAFAFAGIVGAEHPWYFAVPAYALATNTAYSRINDNKHYLHDVVAGATIGLSYALGVYYVRQERAASATPAAAAALERRTIFSILPADELNGAILSASKRF